MTEPTRNWRTDPDQNYAAYCGDHMSVEIMPDGDALVILGKHGPVCLAVGVTSLARACAVADAAKDKYQ